MKNNKHKPSFILILIVCFTIFLFFVFIPQNVDMNEHSEKIPAISNTLKIIKLLYVGQIDKKKLVYGALKGLMHSLDTYSEFLGPNEYKDSQIKAEGLFAGIGIELTRQNKELTIISPIEGSPAWIAGIKPQDQIIKINKKSAKDMSLNQAVKQIRGIPGTNVYLTIMRQNQVFDFAISRSTVKIKSIKKTTLLENNTGYIKITNFQDTTFSEIKNALNTLENQNIKALILDLRNNPGGLLTSAINTADLFLSENNIIVSTRGKNKAQNIIYKASSPDKYQRIPIAVLINKGSSSASEVVAGALQDYKRAVIVGEKSFGKGSVQTVVPLPDNCAIKLTTAKYYTPLGKVIDKKGITPDVIIEDSAKQLENAILILKNIKYKP